MKLSHTLSNTQAVRTLRTRSKIELLNVICTLCPGDNRDSHDDASAVMTSPCSLNP